MYSYSLNFKDKMCLTPYPAEAPAIIYNLYLTASSSII